MKLQAKTIEEASKNLKYMSAYKPYKYGGLWYLTQLNADTVLAYRTLKTVLKHSKTDVFKCDLKGEKWKSS